MPSQARVLREQQSAAAVDAGDCMQVPILSAGGRGGGRGQPAFLDRNKIRIARIRNSHIAYLRNEIRTIGVRKVMY